jgi:hypothetical protein
MYHSLSGQPKPCGQQATRFWDPQSRAWNAWNILKAQVPITIAVASTDLPVFLTKISSKQKSVEELCRPWHRELAHSRPSHEAIPLLLTSPAMSKYRWQHGTVWIHVVSVHPDSDSYRTTVPPGLTQPCPITTPVASLEPGRSPNLEQALMSEV